MGVCTAGIMQRRGYRHCPLLLGLGSLGKGTAGAIPGLCWQDSAILGESAPASHTAGLQVQHVAPFLGQWSGIQAAF